MTETTVTMTLSRYKELEGKEKMMDQYIKDKEIIFIRCPWQEREYYFSSNMQEAVSLIKADIDRTAELAESWRQKAVSAKK